jgi:hypothetical protein
MVLEMGDISMWRMVAFVFFLAAAACFVVSLYSFGKAVHGYHTAKSTTTAPQGRNFENEMEALGRKMEAAIVASKSEARGVMYGLLSAACLLVALGCESVSALTSIADRVSKSTALQNQWLPALQRIPDPDVQIRLPQQDQVAAMEHLEPSHDKIKVKCGKCGKIIVGGVDWAGRMAACPACKGPVTFPIAP